MNCVIAGGGTKITEELQGQKFDAGLELAQPAAVGVYHFYNHDTDSICSLICNGGPKVRQLSKNWGNDNSCRNNGDHDGDHDDDDFDVTTMILITFIKFSESSFMIVEIEHTICGAMKSYFQSWWWWYQVVVLCGGCGEGGNEVVERVMMIMKMMDIMEMIIVMNTFSA